MAPHRPSAHGPCSRLLLMAGLAFLTTACGSEPLPPQPPPVPSDGTLYINELLAAPGSQDDWVEIANLGDQEYDLTGVTLAITPLAWLDEVVIPLTASGVLGSDQFLLMDGSFTDSGPAQALSCARPLQLPDGAFELRLIDDQGTTIDRVTVDAETAENMRPGVSLGRASYTDHQLVAQSRATPGAANALTQAPDPCLSQPAVGSFDDHSYPCIGSVDTFFWLAGSRAETTTVKFDIINFDQPQNRSMAFLDTVFYSVHDEWYYYRMLNGQTFPNETLYQPYEGSFGSIEEIYTWARAVPSLPHDSGFLSWSGDRLYSRRFYDMALRIEPRLVGAGVLIHVPARTQEPTRPELWGFELEFSDSISYDNLRVYFDLLEQQLPAEIHGDLRWFVRSPDQEQLAQSMEQQGLPYADRIVRYTELSSPGETVVYNGGLVAGRVRVVRAGDPGLANATTSDILVLEEIPDYLPPCRALITTVPQTALSHISILAESRGIPNLYVADLTNDPSWDQWGRVRARVALKTDGDDGFQAVQLTSTQYNTWRDLVPDNPQFVPQVDMASAPYTVDPAQLSADQMNDMRPLVGGKSAGFLALMEVFGVSPGQVQDMATPDFPLAITTRAYHDHIQQFRGAWLDALLALPEFNSLSHRQFRYLLLEGEDTYDERYTTTSGGLYKQTFFDTHPPGNWLGDLVRAGGVRHIIAETPVAPAIMAQLLPALQNHFGEFATTQGLRFRSSSNVEDIEGFNGAGLYQSNSGYLDPQALPDPGDRDKTIEAALRATWSSYWSWEAYDERLSANVDHLSGNMGVLVHARFDDERELANGVFTMTRYPEDNPVHAPEQFPYRYEMRLSAQTGSLSVTNPPPGQCVLPEGVVVRQAVGAPAPTIERVQTSSEVDAGVEVLSDTEVLALFSQAVAVTDTWLTSENANLSAEQARRAVTVDFEFRWMDAGWPAVTTGTPFARRMIVKQARSLEPSASDAPTEVRALPIPVDLLGRARTVTRRTCVGDRVTLTVEEVTSDPLANLDLGYDQVPFTAQASLTVDADIAELGWLAGRVIDLVHTDLSAFDHPGLAAGLSWDLQLSVAPERQAALGIAELTWTPDGTWTLSDGAASAGGTSMSCTLATLHATPDNYLLSLLAAP